jgi:hypothetical protein
MATEKQILSQYARMWPREIFYRQALKAKPKNSPVGSQKKRAARLLFRQIDLPAGVSKSLTSSVSSADVPTKHLVYFSTILPGLADLPIRRLPDPYSRCVGCPAFIDSSGLGISVK